jgi:hypothetical protein
MIRNHRQRFRRPQEFRGFVMPNVALNAGDYTDLSLGATTDGTMGVYVYDTTAREWVTATNADLVAGAKFIIAQKIDDKIIRKSQELCFNELSITKLDYRAYVKQISHVGNNGSTGSFNLSTITKGMTFGITIIDDTGNGIIAEENRFTFTYVAKTGDTATIVANALIAKINDVNAYQWKVREGGLPFVTAAAVGATTGIALTAYENGSTFKIALIGEYAINESTITYSTDPVLGSGTAEQVRQMELEAFANEGHTSMNEPMSFWRTDVPTNFFSYTTTYTLINIYGKNTRNSEARPHKTMQHNVGIMIAVPTAQATAFDTIFGL